MPHHSLRFLHAADVFLDRPLALADDLTDSTRAIVERATIDAFRALISAAINRDVDFLLLTGNTFVEADHSLPARVELVAGCERLQAAGIDMFVLPGEADPPTAWAAIPHLPKNVTVTLPHDEPLAVLRDSRVIATMQAISQRLEPDRSSAPRAEHRSPFAIGLLFAEGETLAADTLPSGFDYIAAGGSDITRSQPFGDGPLHDPGGLQGLTADQVGPHGATLVEVDHQNVIQRTFVPTAAVRWERFEVEVDPATTLASLAESIATTWNKHRPEITERLCLAHWTIRCHGSLLDQCDTPSARETLFATISAPAVAGDVASAIHMLNVHHDPASALLGSLDNKLQREFLQLLIESNTAESDTSDWPAPNWPTVVGEPSADQTQSQACRQGIEWFGTNVSEENAPEGNASEGRAA
jgi:hypothetical protein